MLYNRRTWYAIICIILFFEKTMTGILLFLKILQGDNAHSRIELMVSYYQLDPVDLHDSSDTLRRQPDLEI